MERSNSNVSSPFPKNQTPPPKYASNVRRNSTLLSDRFIPDKSPQASILLSPTKKRLPRKDDELYTSLLESEILGLNSMVCPKSPVKSPQKQMLRYSPERTSTPSQNAFKISNNAMSLLTSPRKLKKQISKSPFKVLDAPDLQDDFYLNLVDWGASNILAVGLGPCVYLWNSTTSEVTKMCDLGAADSVTSVSWNTRGTHLSIGTNTGRTQVWDVTASKRTRTFHGHKERVGAAAWQTDHHFSTGSRDRLIINRDTRAPLDSTSVSKSHTQEVCGLKYNPTTNLLASGGNDNKLLVWDIRNSTPLHTFTHHNAAVKAIAWQPTHPNILASGSGTADKHIRFFNTTLPANNMIREVNTGSQVCNIAWSGCGEELISTHGYSQNQVCVWGYKEMNVLTTLTGHTYRVLYLAASPDGQAVVTGAGDETLRFWNVFEKQRVGRDLNTLQMR